MLKQKQILPTHIAGPRYNAPNRNAKFYEEMVINLKRSCLKKF